MSEQIYAHQIKAYNIKGIYQSHIFSIYLLSTGNQECAKTVKDRDVIRTRTHMLHP